MYKKLPTWLIGGMIGVLYFLVVFTWDYVGSDFGQAQLFGLTTAYLNLPGVMVFSAPFVPYALQTSSAFQIATIVVVNFVIGALAAQLISRILQKRTM